MPSVVGVAEAADTTDTAIITALEKDWLQALVHNDEAKLRQVRRPPDCWLIDSQGALATPDNAIAELKSRSYRFGPPTPIDIEVRVIGDWAIVLGLRERTQRNQRPAIPAANSASSTPGKSAAVNGAASSPPPFRSRNKLTINFRVAFEGNTRDGEF